MGVKPLSVEHIGKPNIGSKTNVFDETMEEVVDVSGRKQKEEEEEEGNGGWRGALGRVVDKLISQKEEDRKQQLGTEMMGEFD